MTKPKSTAAYPAIMTQAMLAAADRGELFIPTDKPAALRLEYYGLTGAMRKEGKTELPDLLTFVISSEPSGLLIRIRDNGPLMDDIARALGAAATPVKPSTSILDAEAALERILGGSKP